eukprot:scaffold4162_cov18-Tisochrysis_lutea.AAC.2
MAKGACGQVAPLARLPRRATQLPAVHGRRGARPEIVCHVESMGIRGGQTKDTARAESGLGGKLAAARVHRSANEGTLHCNLAQSRSGKECG